MKWPDWKSSYFWQGKILCVLKWLKSGGKTLFCSSNKWTLTLNEKCYQKTSKVSDLRESLSKISRCSEKSWTWLSSKLRWAMSSICKQKQVLTRQTRRLWWISRVEEGSWWRPYHKSKICSIARKDYFGLHKAWLKPILKWHRLYLIGYMEWSGLHRTAVIHLTLRGMS